jgi:hypothetical protein
MARCCSINVFRLLHSSSVHYSRYRYHCRRRILSTVFFGRAARARRAKGRLTRCLNLDKFLVYYIHLTRVSTPSNETTRTFVIFASCHAMKWEANDETMMIVRSHGAVEVKNEKEQCSGIRPHQMLASPTDSRQSKIQASTTSNCTTMRHPHLVLVETD